MTKYIDGIITAYQRVLQLINDIDPKSNCQEYNLLKNYITVWLNGYLAEYDLHEKCFKQEQGFIDFQKQCAFYDLLNKYGIDVEKCKIEISPETSDDINKKMKAYLIKLISKDC